MDQLNHRKRNFGIILIFALLAVVIYFLLGKTPGHSVVQKTNASYKKPVKQEPVKQEFEDASFEGNGKWYGLCKKNSIHSIEDFRKMVAGDPVLSSHFSDFNWNKARMGKLEKPMHAFVHYRKGDTVFRKKTPISLPAGDGYITDGKTTLRTMCCNSYTAAPPAYETSELEAEPAAGPQPLNVNNYSPPSELFEQSIPEDVVKTPPISVNKVVVPPGIIPHDHPGDEPPPPHDHPDEPKEPPKPPKPVPINAAFWLFGTGLVALIGLRRKFKK